MYPKPSIMLNYSFEMILWCLFCRILTMEVVLILNTRTLLNGLDFATQKSVTVKLIMYNMLTPTNYMLATLSA